MGKIILGRKFECNVLFDGFEGSEEELVVAGVEVGEVGLELGAEGFVVGPFDDAGVVVNEAVEVCRVVDLDV